jgi:hypothetical protein
MGVERQAAKVNWLTSLGMIVAAGTFYRVRKINKSLSSIQIKDFLVKYGFMGEPVAYQAIVTRSLSNQVGEWESIQMSRKRYSLYFKLYKWLDGDFKKQ